MRHKPVSARKLARQEERKQPSHKLIQAEMLFFFSAFLLISFRKQVDWMGILLAFAVPAIIYVANIVILKVLTADKLLMAVVNFLCALGVLILYTTDTEAGTNRGFQQALYYGIGLVVMFVCSQLVRKIRRWGWFVWLFGTLAAASLILPLVFGKEVNGAQNWLVIMGVSIQPSEAVKLALVLVLSYFMSRSRWVPCLLFMAACMLLLMLQKDLGTALVYYVTAIILFYASTGNIALTSLGLVGAGGAAVLGYEMFAHVKRRVAAWQNPWSDYSNSGYQLAQVLMAIASGGLFGVGLGLGSPRMIPVYFTDCIFAVICEQFGVIFGILTLVLYVILILRGLNAAVSARRSFYALIAMGVTAMLGVQTFIIIGGVLKMIPLTGVTMPFVSYGGSSMVSSMGLIGLLQGVSAINQADLSYDYQMSRASAAPAFEQEPYGR